MSPANARGDFSSPASRPACRSPSACSPWTPSSRRWNGPRPRPETRAARRCSARSRWPASWRACEGCAPMSAAPAREHHGTRTVARKLALQALYRWQLNACPWQDLVQEFGEAEDMARPDREDFRALIGGVLRTRPELVTPLAL